jgi:hypothetical protein
VAGQWFSPSTLVSSINKTDRRDIAEILFEVFFYSERKKKEIFV